jgi:two-component system, chemotaxis family, chemotaxis protein CheY
MAKKVMCVDDSSTIRMLVKKALDPEGYEIVEAENGQDGLDKLGADVSLFIVDVNMPVMDGFTFVKSIKDMDEHKAKPVVFLTTESSAQKKELGKELGVNGWIVKPFDPPSLVKVVKMLSG